MGLNFIKNSKYFQSDFIRNSAILVSGNIIGQGIALLIYPILTRFFYSPEDFGVFNLFLSITGLLTLFATASYEEAFLIIKDEKKELSLLTLVLRVLIVFSCILFLLLLFFRSTLLSFFNVETVTEYWYLIPLMVFFAGFFSVLTNLANRERKYKSIASANVALTVESSAFKILLGAFSFKGLGLILANVVSQGIACFSFYTLKDKFRRMFVHRREFSAKSSAVLFKAFPMFTLPRNFINSLSSNLPFLILTGVFGELKLGLFSLAFALGFKPVSLLSGSIYKVLYEKTAALVLENKSVIRIVKKFCIKTFLLALPTFIIVFICAHFLFRIIFGNEWGEAATYFQYTLPWMLMILLSVSISFIPIIFKKQHFALWIELLYLAARLIALYIGIANNNFELSILLFSIIGFLFMLGSLLWYFVLINKYEKKIQKNEYQH